MKTNRKRKNAGGFTLAETLMAVLILLMVSAVVATGMPMAKNAYDKAIDAANAQTLLSTTMTMLRSELSEATYISGTGTASLVYRSSRTGVRTTLTNGREGSGITVTNAAATSPLVTTETATKRLHTEFTKIDYNPATGEFTVVGLQVLKDTTTLASLDSYTVRTVNP